MEKERLAARETSSDSRPVTAVKPGKLQRMKQPMLQMQQIVGNQALVQMLRAKSIQAKLAVSQPGDTYEQEADRVADQVMRMPDPVVQCQSPEEEDTLQTSPLAGTITPMIQRQSPEEEEKLQTSPLSKCARARTITPWIQRQSPEEEEEPLQAKAASEVAPAVDSDVEGDINNLRDGGQPLPEPVRNYFEPRFGYDFSQVRVHTDSRAADTAQAVNAKAFTFGQDVVFNSGQYAPEHEEGKKLIAHELTHVVQQNGLK